MAKYRIRSNERVAFIGKTGSGKTFAARYLLRGLRRVILLDPKGTNTPAKGWDVEPWSDKGYKRLRDGEACRLRVPPPANNEWGQYIERFLALRDATLYIDEMYAIADDKTSKDVIRAALTRGREFGLGVWGATQRPKQVPLFMFTEAEWVLVWRLNDIEDRKRVVQLTGCPDLLEIPKRKYHFWLFNQEWDEPLDAVIREKEGTA